MNWVLKIRCDNCGHKLREDAHNSEFYNSFSSFICVRCGEHGFHDSIERWVRQPQLWKPWTWFSGYWEKKEE